MPRAVDPHPPPLDRAPDYRGLELPGGLEEPIKGLGDLFNNWLNDLIREWFNIDINQIVKDISTWLGLGAQGLQDFFAWIPKSVNDMIAWINDVVGKVWGWFTGLIPVSSLTNEQPNMLEAHGHFPNISSIEANPWWFWDSALTVSPDGSGSAYVDADGTTKALFSVPVDMAPDGPVYAEISLRWQGLTRTGDRPLKLQLIPIQGRGTAEIAMKPITIAEVENPGANNGWMTLAGTWTTPPTGVDGVRMRLLVEDSAQTGRIHWDRGIIRRTNTIPQNWVTGLVQQWNDLLSAFGAWSMDQLDQIWRNICALFGIDPDELNKAISEFNPWEVLDGWITPGLQQTIDSIYSGFAEMGVVGEWINALISPVAEWIYGIFDTGVTANNQVQQLMARLSALETGAANVVDDFGRGSANNLGPNYTHYYSGAGAGSIGTDGKGSCVWHKSGATSRNGTALHQTPMVGDAGHISVVFASDIEDSLFDPPVNYLVCRSDATLQTYVEACIGAHPSGGTQNRIWLRHWVNGNPTDGELTPYTFLVGRSGDLWEFLWGHNPGSNAPNPYRYILRRNGIPIIDWTDTLQKTTVDPAHRHVGLGYETRSRLCITQSRGASLSIFSAVNIV